MVRVSSVRMCRAAGSPGQREEAAQPLLALQGEVLHVVKALPVHQQPAHRHHQDLVQQVLTSPRYPRLGQSSEGFHKGFRLFWKGGWLHRQPLHLRPLITHYSRRPFLMRQPLVLRRQ